MTHKILKSVEAPHWARQRPDTGHQAVAARAVLARVVTGLP